MFFGVHSCSHQYNAPDKFKKQLENMVFLLHNHLNVSHSKASKAMITIPGTA